MASWTAAATSYATRGVPMLPFFIFYSMFGFQRVGDLIWAAADARARGFLLGATAGRTTLMGEGLQHQDGHSLLLASTVPNCQAYDPAFAYEMAAIIKDGTRNACTRRRPPDPGRGRLLLPHPLQRELPDAAGPRGWSAAVEAQRILAEDYDVGVDLWSATSYNELRREALAVERWNRLHPESPERTPLITELLSEGEGPVLAVSDFLSSWADQVVRWVPRPLTVLGTDGFGRSDDRAHLRRFFETDAAHVVVGVLSAMSRSGTIEASLAMKAIDRFGIDADVDPPWTL
jgi:pyruvate dehydrogenase E1 component